MNLTVKITLTELETLIKNYLNEKGMTARSLIRPHVAIQYNQQDQPCGSKLDYIEIDATVDTFKTLG